MDRKRCGECGRQRPEDETALVPGNRSGDWRRPPAHAMRRVCRDCVVEQVEQSRAAAQQGWVSYLDTHQVEWSRAADVLGVDWSGLFRNHYDRKRKLEPESDRERWQWSAGDVTVGKLGR